MTVRGGASYGVIDNWSVDFDTHLSIRFRAHIPFKNNLILKINAT